MVGAFNKLEKLNWKQSVNIQEGDTIFIYVGKRHSVIKYKYLATEVDLPNVRIDDSEFEHDTTNYGNYGRYMELELIESYNTADLDYKKLKENGLNSVQGLSKVTNRLSEYIHKAISL